MYLIGIDYGIGEDIPMFTVVKKFKDKIEVVEVNKIDNFDYQRYVATNSQCEIIGSDKDIERFRKQFNL